MVDTRGSRPGSKRKSKASKGASTSGSQPGAEAREFDTHLFVSVEAQNKYHANIGKRKVVGERGIKFEKFSFAEYFTEQGWEQFAANPDSYSEQLVHEFYANGFRQNSYLVWVRGDWRAFDANSINNYFGLRSFEDGEEDDYHRLLKRTDGADIVARAIGKEGTGWETSTQGALQYYHPNIKWECQALLKFILHRLIPASHCTDVTWDRGMLMYCILKNKTVNVGQLIVEGMKFLMKEKVKNMYGFPSIITSMCLAQGVELRHLEPTSIPGKEIEKDWNDDPEKENAEIFERPARERPPKQHDRMTQYMEECRAWIGRMEQKADDQGARLERLETAQAQMQQQQHQWMGQMNDWMSQHYGGNVPPSG